MRRILFVLAFCVAAPPAIAQQQHEHAQHGEHAMQLFASRDASGTAWLPEQTPMYGVHRRARGWDVMLHGNVFAQFLHDGGKRGAEQGGSINWFMAMARRPAGAGRVGVRGMLSVEPWTIGGCGYPNLLASGEVCAGRVIHDKQHQHDLFMELAAEYDRPLAGDFRWELYGGVAGEPALGPAAYPHRISAMPNPLAPIGHHWLDATHLSFGVITSGVYNTKWKAEASVFNGREPDEHRTGVDLGALDSFSGRLWFAPAPSLALQVSAGRLNEAEAPAHAGSARMDVTRVTASASYHRTFSTESIWATTVAWGRNREAAHATHVALVESNVTLDERHTWFGRLEIGGKDPHDLGVHGLGDVVTVGKIQAGYTRYLGAWQRMKPGVGASVSLGIVPDRLRNEYGGRINTGVGIFATIRPSPHAM